MWIATTAQVMSGDRPPGCLPFSVVDDDPQNGPSAGPEGHGVSRLDPAAGITCVVVWSAGWDKPTWDAILEASVDAGPSGHTLIILTRPEHHEAWLQVVAGSGAGLVEIKA